MSSIAAGKTATPKTATAKTATGEGAAGNAARTRPQRDAGAGRPALRLTRRGRLVVFLAFLLAAVGLVLFALSGVATGTAEAGEPVPVRVVQVEAGDTLWSIATRAAPGEDPRDLIDQIQELNSLQGSLQVGTSIAVPVER